MKFDKLVVVLPCRTLEGYTLDRQTDHAEELLSAWSALYHPLLLAGAGRFPKWVPAEDPLKDPAGSLVMLPPSSEALVAADWLKQAEEAGACVIRGLGHRDAMVEAALERVEGGAGHVDPHLARDFLALGFCHLQMEVLIRDAGYDMGTDVQYYDEQYYDYTGQFDRESLQREAVAAAEAVVSGEEESAREHLRQAFAKLTDARRGLPYTYSADVDPHLVDLTLVAPTTLGRSLREELAKPVPTNLLISGQAVEQMAREAPETLAALKQAASEGKVVVIGGEFGERALPLLGPEGTMDQFRQGLDAYRRHLGDPPTVFGRRRFGLSPVLPQVLRKLGFVAALHFTLDEGQFPTGRQSKIWWVGMDGTELEALAQLPIDASRPTNFLNFAGKVSNTSYQQHNATAVLAHWPGQSSTWYEDLQRAAAYSPVLGEFRTITDYLERSQSISEWTRSGPDDYRSPYLRQAVAHQERDPISRWVRYHRLRAGADAATALSAMVELACSGGPQRREVDEPAHEIGDSELLGAAKSGEEAAMEDRLDRLAREKVGEFAGALPRGHGPAQNGCLVVNPWSFSRRVLVGAAELPRLPAVSGPIRAVGESAGSKQVVIEVPAMGFAWVGPGSEEPAPAQAAKPKKSKLRGLWRRRREESPMAEQNVLRNEHFEVTINPITGAIQAIDDYVSRGALLAEQIAFKFPRRQRERQEGFQEEDPEKDYSVMAADELRVVSAGPVVGRIVWRGRLMSREGKRLARYVQTLEARRGSPILELGIDLEIDHEPDADPWSSYYAARFAWGDATADVYRGVSLASRPTDRPQLESPHFVEVRSGQTRITILTGGLPYHRRFGLRKLDTLLVVPGETARSFRLGIGVNLTHPAPAALDFLAWQHVHVEEAQAPASPTGWLFHVDAKNVVATHWSPVRSHERITGFRVRLLEAEGRNCRVSLRSFRPVRSARKVDFRGEGPIELAAEDDTITVDLKAHEWAQVEAVFAT